jgi:hypothetical protein
MERLGRNNIFLVVNSTILCKAWEILVVQNTWNNRLAYHSMTFVLYQACCKIVQVLEISQSLKLLQPSKVMICLSKAWEWVAGGKVSVRCWKIDSIREEDLIVNINVLLHWLVGI